MSTITLPNIRVGSDLQVRVRLKDGGVAIDWSTLSNIKACIYSDAQRALAGRCAFSIDEEDNTLLVCTYAANKPQYLGVNRIVISAKYMGETKTYDKPAFSFVRWTADQEGEEITIDDPDVDVEIDVEDISSSILQEAVDAAFTAADRANDAAAAAEHMVDIHTGPEGKSAYEVAVEEGYTGTEEEWLASLKGDTGETPDISIGTVTTVAPGTPASASMTGTPKEPVLNLSIPQGVVGATPNFTVGTVTTGEPGSSVIVTITGTPEAPVLNLTIPQGMQGNTGSSVEFPYELVNNLTTNDATKGLSAAQGVVLDGKVSQLEAKVTDLTFGVPFTEITGKYIKPNGTIANSSVGFYSDPIFVRKGETLTYSIEGLNCAILSLYFHGNYTPVVTAPSGTPTQYTDETYTATDDCYIVFSGTPSSLSLKSSLSDTERLRIDAEQDFLIDDRKIGLFPVSTTTSKYISVKVKSGDSLIVRILTAGGAGAQVYLRKDYSSTGQTLIGNATSISELKITASDDYDLIYFYLPNVSGTFKAEITFAGSLFSLIAGGYTYKGIATPNGSPIMSEYPSFYVAKTGGTYTNFGGLVINDGLNIILFDGTNWSLVNIYTTANALNYNGNNPSSFVPGELIQRKIAETDSAVGYESFSTTGYTYFCFPIPNGQKLKIVVNSVGGVGGQLYARKAFSSSGQQLLCNLTAVGTFDVTANDDFDYLYVYVPNISGTCAFNIIRDGGLYDRVGKLETQIVSLQRKIYYQLSSSYVDNDHNAKRFFVYVPVKDDVFIRYRLGQYRPGLDAENLSSANTYWRLEDSALYTLDNGAFSIITGSSVMTSGENEFVMRQTSPNKVDYTGGYHGDEFIYDENGDLIDGAFAEFFADGEKIDISVDIPLTGCNSFFYKERSRMVETANSNGTTTNVGRPIAWHEKRTEFLPGDGYKTENRLDMIENVPFFAFTGICCIARWISEYAMGESDPLTAMGTGDPEHNYQFNNFGNRLVFYKGNGYSAKVTSEVIFGDDDSMQRCYVYNVTAYNKYYRISQTLTDVSKFKSRMIVTFEKL